MTVVDIDTASRGGRKKWTDGGKFTMKDGRQIDETKIRQEFQVNPHHGFRAETIRHRQLPPARPNEGDETPDFQLAKPPTFSVGATCLPPKGATGPEIRAHADQWDVRIGAAGQLAPARERAWALCESCPVRIQCLEAAMAEEGGVTGQHRYLVRGGMLPVDRAKLDRQEWTA